MNVEKISHSNVVPFQHKQQPEVETTTLQIDQCIIHGIPGNMSNKEFEALIAIVNYTKTHQLKHYWFNPVFSQRQSNDKEGRDDVIPDVLEQWLNVYVVWRNDEKRHRYFSEKLAQLPELHQLIIEKKYLAVDFAGKQPLDDFVYGELHMSRAQYYRKKKEALQLLGNALRERG